VAENFGDDNIDLREIGLAWRRGAQGKKTCWHCHPAPGLGHVGSLISESDPIEGCLAVGVQ
jgi:hypothetical protein